MENKKKLEAIDVVAIWCRKKGITYSEFQRLEFYKAVRVVDGKNGKRVMILDQRKVDWLTGGTK